ncbi:class I SAM-dependent methyltransferase [candidate division WOR-3 bacterium]|nr:class I SAM-dependent methyltransferase [candidate division WOR-3 bacterium]
MTEYDQFAPFYDLTHAELTEDIPFWVELARQADGPVCELACGTGRVLLPVARAGIAVTGLDLCQAMLDKLQAKLDQEPREVQSRVALKCAHMRDYRFSQKFRLVFCAFNSFQHLMTTDDQLACLASVRSYLADDGLLCINVFAPFHDRLAKKSEAVEEVLKDGAIARYFTRRDLVNQTIESTMMLETTDEQGLVHRSSADITLCWIHNREMHLLLRHAGFKVSAVYGGWDKRPYDYVSGIQVFVAGKA